MFGDQRSSALLLVAQLRMLVDVMTPGDRLWLDGLGTACEAFIK